MQDPFTKQRRKSYFGQNLNPVHQNLIPTMKKSQSSIKLGEVQTFKNIQQGYYTPNSLKIKFMCKNHVNARSSHFYETSEGQKIYYCSTCSNQIKKQGFSVKNLNQNVIVNGIQSDRKLETKKFDFLKKKNSSYEQQKFGALKIAEEGISQLEKRANLQIIQIDEYSKILLGQLNQNFNDVIKFLQSQKQNCIQMIFDKIDQLKKPLHELKNSICNQKWELEDIKSRINLLLSQDNIQSINESLATISNNQFKKVQQIILKKQQIAKILQQKLVIDKKNCFQSLGAAQDIIEVVYNNFLVKTSNKNSLFDMSPQILSKQIYKETFSEFPSPIRTKNPREPESNQTLKQEIQNIENTIIRQQKSKTYGYFTRNQKAQKINQFAQSIKQHTNRMIKKRPSQFTTISSLTNLMS